MNYARLLVALLLCGLATSFVSAATEKPLTLVAETGESYTVAGASDRELLLLFMSFDCHACRNALPHLETIRKQQRLSLVGVIFPPEEKNLQPRAKTLNITFPLVRGTREIAKQFAIDQTPTLLWYDRQGRLKERFVGEVRVQQLSICLNGAEGEKCGGLVELAARPADFIGKKIVISGMLVAAGSQGNAGSYYLTNGKERVEVLPWLPRELPPKAPGPARGAKPDAAPKTMQNLLGKFIIVSGRVQSGPALNGPALKVENATLQETPQSWQNLLRRRH